MPRYRLVPEARKRKIRPVREVSFAGLDPMVYESRGGIVRRRFAKRPKGMSARQWKKQRKLARKQQVRDHGGDDGWNN